MSNEVLLHTTSASLDWNNVSGATKYHAQISKEIDFAPLDGEDNNLVLSAFSHTLVGGEGKYYWRWRAYVGGNWTPWSEVSSFIYDSGFGTSMTTTFWRLVSRTSITDYYEFELFLRSWEITPEHYRRVFTRNRKGKLLDEWYATKARISLDISRSYLGTYEKAEVLRFFNLHTSFYLVTRLANQTEADYNYHAWEVQFRKPPKLDTPGGNVLDLEEV